MIEFKNVNKTYKSKKSKDTKALIDINLKLDNKGMTFILGKSGSGKSTLLNILGGLDKYDSGDMLILEKSSKDFNAADFDSYRNTYVGFVFQEFNILEDYDVYENIILALQLQQKEIDETKIDELLDSLELTELKKRKVNELSGGQKQRVAIARALIKDPKIILADEPTGNLDSKTGTQVMNLLKEISKDKLVVIVSHDEESAKKYGDRIIEIADGTIINDTKNKKIDGSKDTYKTIKSKLPFKDSFKLGVGSLRYKKVKLSFTILLTIVTLGFFSAADTLNSYDVAKGHSKIIADNNEQFIQIEQTFSDGYGGTLQTKLSEDNIKKVTSSIKSDTYPVYKLYDSNSFDGLLQLGSDSASDSFIYFELEFVSIDDINKILKEKVIGRNPNSDDEIVISNYIANAIIDRGATVYENIKHDEYITNNTFKPNDYEELLNSNYTFHLGENRKVKIVGIVDYDLSNVNNSKITNIYNKVFVNENFISKIKEEKIEGLDHAYRYAFSSKDLSLYDDGTFTRIQPATIKKEIQYYDGTTFKKTSSLENNSMIIKFEDLKDTENYYDELSKYTQNNISADYQTLEKKFFANYVKKLNIIGSTVNLKVYNEYDYDSKTVLKEFKNIKIVGVSKSNFEDYSSYSYLSNDIVSPYIANSIDQTSILIAVNNDINNILKKYPYDGELTVRSTYSDEFYGDIFFIKSLNTLFSYASLIFFIFTIFLVGNFMTNSIQYRKKEIGILRALGARSLDIIKIFLLEGLVISLISGTIASILLVIVSNYCNNIFVTQLHTIVEPFLVGFRQFIVIYSLVFVVTMVSSIIPIMRISKMKPIDAILNK